MNKMKRFFSDPFIRDSLIYSIASLVVSAIAFLIPVIIYRRQDENLANSWIALNGFITIFITLAGGFAVYYAKTISRLAQKNLDDSDGYLISSEIYLHKMALQYGWILVGVVLMCTYFLSFLTWYQAIIIAIAVYAELWATLYRSYFLGRFEYRSAIFLLISAALTRFVGIVGLFQLGLGVDALPVGNLIGSILAVLVGKWYTRNVSSSKKFSVAKDFVASVKTSLALMLASLFLQIGQIVTKGLYKAEDQQALNIASMLAFFGTILYYGASAFLGIFVVNATRSESISIYKKAVLIIAGISVAGTVCIAVLWKYALIIIGRQQYEPFLSYFLMFSIFMMLYNVFTVSIQFLISQYKYREIAKIGGVVGFVVLLLVGNALYPGTHDYYLQYYMGILIGGGALVFGYSYYLITQAAFKHTDLTK